MATASKGGPSSLDEGLNGVVQAISAAMTAPDVQGQAGQALMQLLQATIGIKKMGAGGGKPAGGPPGGGPPGGGMAGGINQLQGAPPSPPSAGPAGGPSPSGISADDMRQAVAAG